MPAEVKRAVYVRDRGCCQYRFADGRTCGSRAFVEFHHVKPWMAGGEAEPENIELRCAPHNRYEARLFYGRPDDEPGNPVRTELPGCA